MIHGQTKAMTKGYYRWTMIYCTISNTDLETNLQLWRIETCYSMLLSIYDVVVHNNALLHFVIILHNILQNRPYIQSAADLYERSLF